LKKKEKMKLVDSHAHLNEDIFDEDLDEVIERAKSSGVEKIVVVGYDLPSSEKAISLSQRYPGFLYATCGIHPHEARNIREIDFEYLRQMAMEPSVVAIGETGLDYFKMYSPKDIQKDVFISQLEIARELSLPVVIHTRKAFPDVLQIVENKREDLKGVFHCFSGGVQEAKKITELDFFISFSGSLTYGSKRLEESLKIVRPERLLIETDSPYLSPSPVKGRRNEPSFLLLVFEKVCSILQKEKEKLAERICLNSSSLFNLAK